MQWDCDNLENVALTGFDAARQENGPSAAGPSTLGNEKG